MKSKFTEGTNAKGFDATICEKYGQIGNHSRNTHLINRIPPVMLL